MTVPEQQLDAEKSRMDNVIEQITERIGHMEKVTEERKSAVTDIRQNFWSDITVNVDEIDDIMETISAVKQQTFVLKTEERGLHHAEETLDRLKRMKDAPYFARIDFREDGVEQSEPLYIGIASFMKEPSEQYLIYDWRAPISNLFYDYAPGPAAYETPMGSIKGEMTLKRQFIIRNGNLRYMFDTGVTIGDEVLQQILGKSADEHMKSIVATIQKEQNQIIRDDKHRLLIVQGAAGSGKTSVALQRVAYQLYKHRQSLNADNMVLFSPNALFNSYVSTVLPELGEANMQQTTYQEYLNLRLGALFQVEDPYTQLEYILTSQQEPGYDARISGIRYKASAEFFQVISRYKELLEREGLLFKNITFRGRILLSSRKIAQRFYEFDPSIRLSNRIVLVKEWLLKQLREMEKAEWSEDWVREEIELLDTEQYQKVYLKLRKQDPNLEYSFDFHDKETELLSKMIVREKFDRLREKIKKLQFVNVTATYKQLFTNNDLFAKIASGQSEPEHWQEICRYTIERLEQKQLAYEDATPMLFLSEIIQGFHTLNTVRHVLIDEAQDYSPFQYEFLKRLFPRSKMTLLGDLNQSIYAHAATLGSYQPLIDLYGESDTRIIRLTKSYRSTQEIVEFTKAMLPGGEAIEPFNRSGAKPKVFRTTGRDLRVQQIAQDIDRIKSQGMQSIAVICKTALESKEAYELLNQHTEMRLVTSEDHTFTSGTLLFPAYLAKGLEFDAVIIYDASDRVYKHEAERKLFYTACTRAMHQLYLYYEDQLTPFVKTIDGALYETVL
ncbi:RNA polymerase recycling motor HelD [Paenibacillus thalictri]|uniref:Helicase n=1 Tax=Paenibacillus thalictri TaxID=2527873 RepID=A0A4Q9DC52_9BACL|nr:RNA polymerase recycling motor HelD [Paenibacillus thalictri]TBL67631.1 helicase [Paenibacillus thalictri]